MRKSAFIIITLAGLVLPASASAHTQILGEVEPGEETVFTISSPNESESEMTGLRLTIPESLDAEGIVDAPGFTAEIVRDQAGRATVLSWQGGALPPEHLGLFQFSGTVAEGAEDVTLTGTQTFADGSSEEAEPVIEVGHSHSEPDWVARGLAAAGLGLAAVALVATRRRPAK